jgi:CheY-like chemotaxis protein
MLKPIKILSVEDDEFMRIFLKDVFWLHGRGNGFNACEFEMVDNVRDAEEKIADPEAKPDLIFLDLMLPQAQEGVLDREAGFKFLKKIKSNPKTKDIKIIIFSAYKDKELQEKALKLGAEKFLLKGEHLPQDLIKIAHEVFH